MSCIVNIPMGARGKRNARYGLLFLGAAIRVSRLNNIIVEKLKRLSEESGEILESPSSRDDKRRLRKLWRAEKALDKKAEINDELGDALKNAVSRRDDQKAAEIARQIKEYFKKEIAALEK